MFGAGSGVRVGHGMGGHGWFGKMVFYFVFAVDDDGPAWREDILVSELVVDFELDATKDGSDGQGHAIGQVDGCWSHVVTPTLLRSVTTL